MLLHGQMMSTITLSADSVMVGDQVELSLNIKNIPLSQRDLNIDFSSIDTIKNLGIEGLENFRLDLEWQNRNIDESRSLGITIDPKKGNSGGIEWSETFKFIIWDMGVFQIPHPIIYTNTGEKVEIFNGQMPTILVNAPMESAPLDTTQIIHDIAPIQLEAKTWQDHLYWIIPVVFLLLVLLAVLYGMRRKLKESQYQAAELPEEIIPSHITALQKLKALRSSEIWKTGDIKEFQSSLTYIVREYLENRYDIQALESTTGEILEDLRKISFDKDYVPTLKNILQIADLVKFAKADPPDQIHEEFLNTAEDFVNNTKEEERINNEDELAE